MTLSRSTALLLPLLFAAAAAAQPPANGQYSGWTRNEPAKRYECTYTYPNKDGGTSKQVVAVYPKDNPRYGWAYFYNAKNEPWGRCAIRGNPKYDAKKMYWQQLNARGDGYEEFKNEPAGFCPTPKDGKGPILSFPDPPV